MPTIASSRRKSHVASSNQQSTQTQSDLLGQIEALFNDLNTPATGISGALNTLFNDFT